MNLVMKRMEETKKIRMRLRERQLEEEEDRYRKKEMDKKLQLERISKNQEWREKKKSFGSYGREEFLNDCISNRKVLQRESRINSKVFRSLQILKEYPQFFLDILKNFLNSKFFQ